MNHQLTWFEDKAELDAATARLDEAGIYYSVQGRNGRYSVWLYREDDLPKACEVLGLRYAMPAAKDPWEISEPTRRTSRRRGGSVLSGLGRVPPITLGLIAVSIIVFLLTAQGRNGFAAPLFFSQYSQGMPEIMAGQLWRLITPIFLHFNLMHIAFNLLWVWELGRRIEQVDSTLFYAFLVLTTAALSNIAQYMITPSLFGGMSGVVYGLFGYVMTREKLDKRYPLTVPPALAIVVLVFLLLGLSGLLDAVIGPMANLAHLGGLATGAMLGLIMALRSKVS